MDIVWLANVEVTCLEDPKDTRRLKYYRYRYTVIGHIFKHP